MKPGDRTCHICGFIGPETDVGPALIAVEAGNGQVRYDPGTRCRDRRDCRRRVDQVGGIWPSAPITTGGGSRAPR